MCRSARQLVPSGVNLAQGVIAAGRTGTLAEILLPTIASVPLSVLLLHLLQAVVTLHLLHC